MIGGFFAALFLQAAPIEPDWRLMTPPDNKEPIWLDLTSIRGPRQHREIRLRGRDGQNNDGIMTAWVDCDAQTMTVTAIYAKDSAGKPIEIPAGARATGSFAGDATAVEFAELVCKAS